MTDLADVRRRAWKTRRAKYGAKGHNAGYGGYRRCHGCQTMMDLILRLHNEGTLSEGQACKATGLGRVDLRTRAQSHPSYR